MLFRWLLSISIFLTAESAFYLDEIRYGAFDQYDMDVEAVFDNETSPWAVGMTKDCVAYEYMEGISWKMKDHSLPKHRCEEYKVFAMQFEDKDNITMNIVLAMRIFGPRLEIQNALSGKAIFKNNFGSAYIFKRKYRETFLTNALPPGQIFQDMFNVGYKVYVLVRTKSDLRIQELKLIMQDFNTPKFYLTIPVILPPTLFPPSNRTKVHVFDMPSEIESFLQTMSYTTLVGQVLRCRERQKAKFMSETILLYLEYPELKAYEIHGSLFLMSSIRRKKPYLLYLPNLPLFQPTISDYCRQSSLVSFLDLIPGRRNETDRTTTSVYHLTNIGSSSVNSSESTGRAIFRQKLFNPSNFHSRMAYPHALYYNPLFNRDLLAPTNKSLLPLFMGTCFGIFLLSKITFVVLKCAFMIYYGIFRQTVEDNVRKYKSKT